jgi:hypothetical protein
MEYLATQVTQQSVLEACCNSCYPLEHLSSRKKLYTRASYSLSLCMTLTLSF